MIRTLSIALVLAAVVVGAGARESDLVPSMPGFGGDNNTLPFPLYSGYLSAGGQKHLHYWLAKADTVDPTTAPTVLWMNGGPGCSSGDGFLYEQGPFRFVNPDIVDQPAGAVPATVMNPNRWNRVANVIFLEAPVGVGFSYSDDPNDYNMDDHTTALANYQALVSFFAAFPELAATDFWITGESYAGIYVPTLFEILHDNIVAGNTTINLKGVMVGNGCTGNAVGACSAQGNGPAIELLAGHDMISLSLYAKIQKACPDPSNPGLECDALLNKMENEAGPINVYNLIGPCVNGNGDMRTAKQRLLAAAVHGISPMEMQLNTRSKRTPGNDIINAFGGVNLAECIDGAVAGQLLNNADVQTAFHITPGKTSRWTVCTGSINYDRSTATVMPIYTKLAPLYSVNIYSGSSDGCVPTKANEASYVGLGFPVSSPWSPWYYNDSEYGQQVGGYTMEFDVKGNSPLRFIVVHGAGHMVPEFRPAPAFHFFSSVLNGNSP